MNPPDTGPTSEPAAPQRGPGAPTPARRRAHALRRAVPALAIALGTATAPAQTADQAGAPGTVLEEVLVSAELLPTRWLEQAGSSSIIDAASIDARAAVHLEDVLLTAPNVNLSGGSNRARFYQIRGIGERSQFVEPLNSSIGLLIDNVDFSGLGTAAGLYDIEQVEVLRGPQGTLHGANALAGLIALRSAAPTDDFEARLTAGAGDYARRDVGAVVSGPLRGGDLLGRLAAYQHRSDGFIRNAYLGRSDSNRRDERMLRGRLRWYPQDGQQLDLMLLRADVDNGYDAFSLDNTRTTLSDQPGRDRQLSNAAGLHWQYTGTTLRGDVLASVADSESEYSYDEDWSYVGIAPELEYSSFDRYLRDRRSYSLQLRLSSAQPAGFRGHDLDWVAGLYWLDDDERLRRQYTYLDRDFRSRFEAKTAAAFGQADLQLSSAWRFSAGLRVARRAMRYGDSEGVGAQPDTTLWGGKLALGFDTGRWGNFYAALSRGYRAGGVNAGILALPPAAAEETAGIAALRFFDQELLYNVEVGHKGRFAGGRIHSALTLFYMDRSEQQVRGSLVLPRSDGSTAFVDFTDNAASGHNLGLELELRGQVTPRLGGYLNVGLLRARFDDYINADGRDLADREQAHAPGFQFALGVRYAVTDSLYAEAQWEGRDSFYFSDRHGARAPDFALLHLRLGWDSDRLGVALWARNVLDEDYFIRGFGSFGNDPRKGYAVEEYRQFGEPRQIGVTVDARF